MALKKKPVTGMKDILPKEMEVRNYVTGLIRETYGSFGFTSIETPGVEHIENLCSKQGGDNEKLIFKILKRGEKLKLDQAKEEAARVAKAEALKAAQPKQFTGTPAEQEDERKRGEEEENKKRMGGLASMMTGKKGYLLDLKILINVEKR